MADWVSIRRVAGWQLQRSGDGLARVVEPSGRPRGATSIGKALIEYKHVTRGVSSQRPNAAAILVHGMLGEREGFPSISTLFSEHFWSVEHFRYPTTTPQFGHHVHALERLVSDQLRTNERLCLVGHSFGCRLIASALSNRSQRPCDVVFIAPPVRQVRWAKVGQSISPVRSFLGGSLEEMANHVMDQQALARQRLLVIEGQSMGRGDGWLHQRETDLSACHERRHISASHARLPGHPETRREIERFLRL